MASPAYWQRRTRAIALRHGLDPDYFERQISRESMGFNPGVISGRIRSPAGAVGIAQFMPGTAAGLGVNPLRPERALHAAAGLMRSYLNRYRGDWRLALAAYNAGPGAVAQYHGVPPYSETQAYIRAVLAGGSPIGSPQRSQRRAQPQPSQPNFGGLLRQALPKPPQLHAQLLAQQMPTASPVGSLTPNPITPQGITTSDLYSQVQQLRRRLLSA